MKVHDGGLQASLETAVEGMQVLVGGAVKEHNDYLAVQPKEEDCKGMARGGL